MQTLKIAAVFVLLLFSGVVTAATEVANMEAGIGFSLPDTWEPRAFSPNRGTPKMDSSDPLSVTWKRIPISGRDGGSVSAGLNLVAFKVSPSTEVIFLSNALMHRRGWPFAGFLSAEKDGLTLPNSIGYFSKFSTPSGLTMKVFVVHAINNGKFVELILSATDDVFEQMEPEFRGVLKSIHLVK